MILTAVNFAFAAVACSHHPHTPVCEAVARRSAEMQPYMDLALIILLPAAAVMWAAIGIAAIKKARRERRACATSPPVD